jgi:DNA modification methylase
MSIAHRDDWLTIHQGDCRAVLAGLEAGSVHCVVTSPPYWGLRDYGTASWEGGDAGCDHKAPPKGGPHTASTLGPKRDGLGPDNAAWADSKREHQYRDRCGKCGATRHDAQLGLEPTPDEYVANMVAVFREVRRVLRDDGTLWLNLGDTFAANRGYQVPDSKHRDVGNSKGMKADAIGLKPKDLVGIPWAVARALQAPYYTGRIPRERDRVWLAAMVDAEGTICGFDHDRADGGGHRSGVHLTITNTSTALLDEAHRIWPTSRSEHDRPGEGHMGLRPSWRWIVHGIENKMAALRDLYPHLVVKRQQAVAAYTLLTLMADAKRLARTPQAAEVVAKRAVLTGLLSDLNQGRPVTPPSWLIEPPSTFEPGWYLRSDIIWSKPNPMPESVTDRPTKSHEYLFLLAKSERYYFDADAVREGFADERMGASGARSLNYSEGSGRHDTLGGEGKRGLGVSPAAAGRNIRSVWTIATQPYPGAHFATFPPKLVEPCILAGTSERGVCPECGAPWRRVVERVGAEVKAPRSAYGHGAGRNDGGRSQLVGAATSTTGWRPTCAHGHCVTCDNEPNAERTNVPSVQTDVSPRPPRAADLLDRMREPIEGRTVEDRATVPGVRGVLRSDEATGDVLFPDLLERGDGTDQADHEGLRGQPQGLHPPVPAEAPDGDEDRLRGGAPTGDGGDAGPDAGAVGGRGSHQRHQERQPAGEPAGADEADARSHLQPGSGSDDDMPGVRAPLPSPGTCDQCGGQLTPLDPVPGVVLDVFGGSGTTAMVAQHLGRRAVLIELNPDYIGQQLRRNAAVPLGLEATA